MNKLRNEIVEILRGQENCKECSGKKVVDWHYLDGTIKMEDCPRCYGIGIEIHELADRILKEIEKERKKRISEEDFIFVCKFLSREGYLDDDWWCEEPTALERFMNSKDIKARLEKD